MTTEEFFSISEGPAFNIGVKTCIWIKNSVMYYSRQSVRIHRVCSYFYGLIINCRKYTEVSKLLSNNFLADLTHFADEILLHSIQVVFHQRQRIF